MKPKQEYQRHEDDTDSCFICGGERRGVAYFPHRKIDLLGSNKFITVCNSHMTIAYNLRETHTTVEEFVNRQSGSLSRKYVKGDVTTLLTPRTIELGYVVHPNVDPNKCMYCEEDNPEHRDIVPSIEDLRGFTAVIPRYVVPCCKKCVKKMGRVVLTANTIELRKEFILGYEGPKAQPGDVVTPTRRFYERK